MHAYLNLLAYLQESRSSTSNGNFSCRAIPNREYENTNFQKGKDTKDRGKYEIRYFTRGTETCLDLSSQV